MQLSGCQALASFMCDLDARTKVTKIAPYLLPHQDFNFVFIKSKRSNIFLFTLFFTHLYVVDFSPLFVFGFWSNSHTRKV